MKKVQKKRKGFTLAELVVVVTILGILMVIAISRFSSISDSANKRAFQANHKIAASAITMYMADKAGAKPGSGEKFEDYISSSTDGSKGIDSLQGKPEGAAYAWDGTNLTSTYKGDTLTFTP